MSPQLSAAKRHDYEIKARALLYPDLRGAYVEDALMVEIMANALAQVDRLAQRGSKEAAPRFGRDAVTFYPLPSEQFDPGAIGRKSA